MKKVIIEGDKKLDIKMEKELWEETKKRRVDCKKGNKKSHKR